MQRYQDDHGCLVASVCNKSENNVQYYHHSRSSSLISTNRFPSNMSLYLMKHFVLCAPHPEAITGTSSTFDTAERQLPPKSKLRVLVCSRYLASSTVGYHQSRRMTRNKIKLWSTLHFLMMMDSCYYYCNCTVV